MNQNNPGSGPAAPTNPASANPPAQGGGGKPGGGQDAAIVRVRPMAGPARMKKRHGRLMLSFLALVVAPVLAVAVYLWAVAVDQYSSTTGFAVRQEEGNAASALLGGLSQLAGGTVTSDSNILYEFIQSQEIVTEIDNELDLRNHYGAHWGEDPAFALWPDASIEDMLWYWQRVVRLSYDQSSGLIEVRVLAYTPQMAQDIARQIVAQSQKMINALNDQARKDALRYARSDLDDAVARLKTAREALTQFRSRTQIVDPEADLQGRMGVMGNLQQQLAEALIEHDLLLQTAAPTDPRVVQASRKIDVIRDRIREERDTFTSNTTENGSVGEDYPKLIAEFEGLTVDREYAEQTYRAALSALELARANADRQSRYLATYIQPTLPQTSEFPRRLVLLGLAVLFLVLVWSIMALIYYSLRDRS